MSPIRAADPTNAPWGSRPMQSGLRQGLSGSPLPCDRVGDEIAELMDTGGGHEHLWPRRHPQQGGPPALCQRVEYDSFTEPWRRGPIALRRQAAIADRHSAGNAADSQNTTGLPAVSCEFVSDVGCFVPGLKLSSRSEVPPLIGRARYRPLLFRRAGKCCGRFESRCPSKSTPGGCFRTRR
jgi:hypothetical protein